jgi:hypothetical protein
MENDFRLDPTTLGPHQYDERMYRDLNPARIVETSQALRRRICERFPESGLSRVAAELLSVVEESAAISRWLAQPHLPIRLLAAAGIVVIVAVVIGALSTVHVKLAFTSVAELLQGLEAGINEIVFLGIAIFFLLTLEVRLKRSRALKAIHVLRSIAHIIDMHQLTKDPERLMTPDLDTVSSPKRTLKPFELVRYLDYCSELLAIISKVGALYVQRFADPVTLSAVNDVEDLTAGLSRKIWQKIMILDRIVSPDLAVASPEKTTHPSHVSTLPHRKENQAAGL